MDNDKPFKRFVIAAGILVRDRSVLLVENHWPSKTAWTLPGGVVEPSESVTDALKREFREETNLDIVEVGLLGYVLQNRVSTLNEEGLVLAFHVQSVSGKLAALNDEFVRNARFVPFEELQSMLTSPVNLTPLERFLEAPSKRAIFYYFDDCDGGVKLRFTS